ncbi:hypothetical protein WN943_016255 [Citrus x changshan-huyou]
MLAIQVNGLSEPTFFFWGVRVYYTWYLTRSLSFP